MCGRAAQSVRGVEAAEELLAGAGGGSDGSASAAADQQQQRRQQLQQASPSRWGNTYNNVNMAPGMEGLVLRKVEGDSNANIECIEMRWGLIPKGGTKASPLPTPGPSLTSLQYSNLMYNARSDTLYDKRTFRDLALRGKTCIVAVDGFYEWKAPQKSAIGGGSGKQPYYVHRSGGQPLLIAGLYTSVPTGRDIGSDGNKPEMLTTYTLLTTDACPKLRWLHHRQPVFLWDVQSANEWLHTPTPMLEKSIAQEASTDHDALTWHPVTKRMNKTQYREKDCNVAIKIETVPSVKSFFTHKGFAAKKSSEGSKTTEALVETGPKDYLEEGWKEKAASQMEQSKRQSPRKSPLSSSNATTSPASKRPKLFPPSSPSGEKNKSASATKKQSPARKGQITSFFSAPKNTKS